MSGSAQDKSRRVGISINRLISQIIPDDPALNDEDAQVRHDGYFETVKGMLEEESSEPLADHNHASDLIKRHLVQTNPGQALRYSNLYSRLLSLPVLNHKWAMLYLLYKLNNSPDPAEPDLAAFAEFQQERAHLRREEKEQHEPHRRHEPPKSNTPSAEYNPTELRDVLKNPKDIKHAYEDISATQGDRRGNVAKDDATGPAQRDVSIRSKLLADNYSAVNPPEPSLLRDLPYTLQGLSSATLPFAQKGNALVLPPSLPPPLIGLLHTLAEPSLLYRDLEEFVRSPAQGLLGQSLRAAIEHELRSYLTLVATLEGQIRHALATIDQNAPRSGIGKAGVTLKRCVVWTREATMGLRLLSMIAEESKRQKGGRIISLIHSFSASHGDPIVGAFAERLLTPVTRPFYDILRHWIYDGELSDPYSEFFVKEPSTSGTAKKSGNVWDDKYEIDESMVPSIMTSDFAEKVFLIGKSLNFIRHSCGDAQWVEAYSKQSSKELRYGNTETLEAWIGEAYVTTMHRLLHLMTTKFHLFEHLRALKDYMLLGQGDFIALLLESLSANLDRPAGAQYRHTLTAQLEHAIRGSNAQYDNPEVLRRLDARMLQLTHGDIGWDCFTLEYKIDAPVDVVVSDWGNRQYLKVFNFLWRVKRVEFALSSTWRKVTTGSRGVLQTRRAAVAQTWKTTRGSLAEMVHFTGQLQYYILFEVIESSWTELQAQLHADDATLDTIILAHTNYLNSITHKGLLGARRRRFPTSSKEAVDKTSNEEDDNSYMHQLGDLLRTMLSYRECVDGLYSWSVTDFTRRQEADLLHTRRDGPRKRQPAKKKKILDDDDDSEDDDGDDSDEEESKNKNTIGDEFPALRDRLRHLGDRFRTRLQILLGDLASQPDVDLRFLGVSMNFNDVYQPVRRKVKGSTAAAAANTSTVTTATTTTTAAEK